MRFYIALFLVLAGKISKGQDNYSPGYVIDSEGTKIKGFVDDQLWTVSPKSIQFKDEQGLVKTYAPEDVLEFGIESGALYKSLQVRYDSSSNLKDLSDQFLPEYKSARLFLRVVVLGEASLLQFSESQATHFFIRRGGLTEELINHYYYTDSDGIKTKRVNQTYIEQIRKYLNSCKELQLERIFPYNEKKLTEIFMKYNICLNSAPVTFARPRVLTKFGFAGMTSFDRMRKDFEGGIGYGAGFFINFKLPNKLYKMSVYNEFTYRKFARQVGDKNSGPPFYRPFNEVFELNSFKASSLFKTRIRSKTLDKQPYWIIGFTYSFGLSDSYYFKDAGYNIVARKAEPTWALVGGGGITLGDHLLAELRYERGSGTNFKDIDVFTTSTGYSSAIFALAYQF